MDEYVSKPVDPAHLSNVLLHHLKLDNMILQSAEIVENPTPGARFTTESLEHSASGLIQIDIEILNKAISSNLEMSLVILAELIEVYPQTTYPCISKMKFALRARDWDQLAKEAHFLKSSSRSLGATMMADGSFELEKLCKAHSPEWDRIGSIIDDLEKSAVIVEGELLACLESKRCAA